MLFFITLLWATALEAISVSTTPSAYTVDTGSSYGFYVSVSRTSCDITSVFFHDSQWQYSGSFSQIASGLGNATVSYTTSGSYVIVTCVANSSHFDLTHYMVFKDGEANIYMGINTNAEPSVGELRFIMRLTGLTDPVPFYEEGNVCRTDGGSTVEGSDVFLVAGQTRSKFYSSNRFIDDHVYCATNGTIHACWLRPGVGATEKSSGGPFMRDIDINWTGKYNSLTYYMNSGHVQTEPFRQGFHGPFVFSISSSGVPSTSSVNEWIFDDIGVTLPGYIKRCGRGFVRGKASGTDASKGIVLHWHNKDYQGWVYANVSTGDFSGPWLVAGDYRQDLYQGELLAASKNVTVTAGGVTTANIHATNKIITGSRTTLFQMGDYDGQPTGFLNAGLQLRMHPSDNRMAPWAPGTVAATAAGSFPMAIFQDINNGTNITFSLSSPILVTAHFRMATTLAFKGGRPVATVNGYVCSRPRNLTTIDSRGVTRGAYRGHGEVYTCVVPAGNLVQGTNTISISIASRSSGHRFLSPYVIFDALELFIKQCE